jgi:hypothetical protein
MGVIMTNVHNVDAIRELMNTENEESYGDFIYELHQYDIGQVIDFQDAEVPAGWVVTVKEVNDERDYDSYGNSQTDNAYVILSVSDGADEALYKLPGSYASYSGWEWEINNIVEVNKTSKTITIWEWKPVD